MHPKDLHQNHLDIFFGQNYMANVTMTMTTIMTNDLWPMTMQEQKQRVNSENPAHGAP